MSKVTSLKAISNDKKLLRYQQFFKEASIFIDEIYGEEAEEIVPYLILKDPNNNVQLLTPVDKTSLFEIIGTLELAKLEAYTYSEMVSEEDE